MLGCEVLLVS